MSRRAQEVFVCAGEASGDLYGAQVVRALRRMRPELSFWGAGGGALEDAGVVLRHRVEELAVTGFSELRKVAWSAGRLLLDSRAQLRQRRPALALLVDYPGANLRLAAMAKASGVPVLYYVAPQRWAWLSWRLGGLRRNVDRLAAILPFEEAFFTSRSIPTTFVGHPLLDLQGAKEVGVASGTSTLDQRPLLTLWPGSRSNELEAHLPLLAAVGRRLGGEFRLRWVAGQAWAQGSCERALPGIGCLTPEAALQGADLALCASGSATLQLALANVPMAVFYRVGRLSALIGRALLRVRYVSLPNLIAGGEVVPELLQDEMTIPSLVEAARSLARFEVAARQREAFSRIRQGLGQPGVGERVAGLALQLL